MSEVIGIFLSFIYIGIILFVAEFIRKRRNLKTSVTREIIHIGVSLWGIGIYFIFKTWWGVLIPPLIFTGLNYLSYKYEIFKAMEIKGNIGTVLYPFSLCIIFPIAWKLGHKLPAVAALLTMGLGDGFAGIIGSRWGKHKYRVFNTTKSIEGSIAMFTFSFIAFLIVVIGFTNTPGDKAILCGILISSIATFVEAISPPNIDNLTVPFVVFISSWFIL